MDFDFGNFGDFEGDFAGLGDFGDSYFFYERILKAIKTAEEGSQKQAQKIMDTILGEGGICDDAKHHAHCAQSSRPLFKTLEYSVPPEFTMFEALRGVDLLLGTHTRKTFKSYHRTVEDRLAVLEVNRTNKEKILPWVILGAFFGIAFILVPGVKRVHDGLRLFAIVCIGFCLLMF